MSKATNRIVAFFSPILLSCFFEAILGNFEWYRKLIGGEWVHFFTEDGQVEWWLYVPSNKEPKSVLPPVYYALHQEYHPYKFNHTSTGVIAR